MVTFSLSSTKGKYRQPSLPKTLIPFLSAILPIEIRLVKNWWAVVDDYIDVLRYDSAWARPYDIRR